MNTIMRIQFTRKKFICSLSLILHRYIAVQSSGLLVLIFICLSIDSKAQTVIEKTLCKTNGKYAVFAHRPLKRLPFISQPRPTDSFFDRNNVQLAHEHIFFCNNGRLERNVGFGPDGRFSEESFSGKYRLVNDQKYNTSIINSILGPDACYKSEVGTYGLSSNNCQDFAARVRSEYNRRMAALAPNTQEGRLSCQAAVNNVLLQMKAKGARRPHIFRISKGTANQGRIGNPTSRLDELDIAVTDTMGEDKKALQIMESQALQLWADAIAISCPNTAVITFGIADIIEYFFVWADARTTNGTCMPRNPSGYSSVPWGKIFSNMECP